MSCQLAVSTIQPNLLEKAMLGFFRARLNDCKYLKLGKVTEVA